MRAVIVIKRAAVLGLAWLAISGAEAGGLAVGAAATAAGTWLSLRLMPPGARRVRLAALLRLVPGFLWRSLLGGVDVAWRALHPRMPLAPGWVVLPSRLPPGGARVTLGGEFSLLPGTLVAGTRRGALLIHCLDREQAVAEAVRAEEARLAAAIGEAGR